MGELLRYTLGNYQVSRIVTTPIGVDLRKLGRLHCRSVVHGILVWETDQDHAKGAISKGVVRWLALRLMSWLYKSTEN